MSNIAATQDYVLQVPIKLNGVETSTVTVRRPKAGDLRQMDRQKGSQVDKTLYLIGRLCDLAPAEVDEIDAADLEGLGKIVEGFMPARA
jgi:hypothetical protein